jgi:alkaline phosphatase D
MNPDTLVSSLAPHPYSWLAALAFALTGTLSPTQAQTILADPPTPPPGAARPAPLPSPAVNPLISRLALGSCMKQDRPVPILRTVMDWEPELFIWLGDNIYGDTHDMNVLEARYQQLAAKPLFAALRAKTPMVATWDDHDYGLNDAGSDYTKKEESKEIFLRFWNEPEESERRQRPGIHTSYTFTDPTLKKSLQVIMLDTRTFRTPLTKNTTSSYKNDYRPDSSPANTFLGADQWNWLKSRLQEPADLRLIGTSIQFGHEYNGWESWTNFPTEIEKMVDLIKETKANGVVFLSGDVHWGELSVLKAPGCYPLHDLTASGINEEWDILEPNRNRVGQACMDHHFGFIEINWHAPDPSVALHIKDVTGRARVKQNVRLSHLKF